MELKNKSELVTQFQTVSLLASELFVLIKNYQGEDEVRLEITLRMYEFLDTVSRTEIDTYNYFKGEDDDKL